MSDHLEAGLWATQRKAFIEASRERDIQTDRNRMPTCSSEWWRGYESCLDDLIRTVASLEPTASPELTPAPQPEAGRRGDEQGEVEVSHE